jgi:epoxyqueuosine reductase
MTSSLAERARAAGIDAGLTAVGFCTADPFDAVRVALEERRAAGVSADMQFTYRNPARSTDPTRSLEGARSIVAAALAYAALVPEPEREPDRVTGPRGRVARYATVDHYAVLRAGLDAVAEVLEADGHRTRVLADDNAQVDRAVAHRAGLGWWGKNANLLVPGHGSWVVLGGVITDAELPPAEAPVDDGCGTCRRCLEGCPTGAIVAPGVVDARTCLAWLVQAPGMIPIEHRVAMGDRIYGCDDCQEVCPPSRVAIRPASSTGRAPSSPASAPVSGQSTVDLVSMVVGVDDELLERYGRWYVPRRDPAALRRNALVALGNVGDPDDPDVQGALRSALAHPNGIVRAHAVWAARRLGLDVLLVAVARDDDPLVVDELAVASGVAPLGTGADPVL